jgi:hypothetical protein
MHWAPIFREQQSLCLQRERDIADLVLIAHDSVFARNVAASDYTRTRVQCAEAAKSRRETLAAKTEEHNAMVERQQLEAGADHAKAAKTQASLNSQPSVLRKKLNKAARERREERFRQVAGMYEEIRDEFGTTDPDKIAAMFQERRETTATLEKQIADLCVSCEALERRADQLRSMIEEAEYASSKGVGGDRLLAEGNARLAEKEDALAVANRELDATEKHQRKVSVGIAHLVDVMALVRGEEETLPSARDGVLRWIHEKCRMGRAVLSEEDVDFLTIVNKKVFAQLHAAAEKALGMDESDAGKRVKKVDQGRKQKTGDVQTRVLDRNTIKAQAMKAAQAASLPQKKSAK